MTNVLNQTMPKVANPSLEGKCISLINSLVKDANYVTFKKKNGTVTTRRIAPISNFKDSIHISGTGCETATIKVVDLDKVANGEPAQQAIISFHYHQLIDVA